MLVAVVAGLALLGRGGALDHGGADATVVLELREGVAVDTVRQEIAQQGDSAWEARQVGESSGQDDDHATMTMSLPGSNLDSAITWLRASHNTQADRTTVDYSVDPDQLDVTPLASSDRARAPRPVVLQVRLIGDTAGPSSAVTVGAMVLLLAVVSAGMLAWWWFRTQRE